MNGFWAGYAIGLLALPSYLLSTYLYDRSLKKKNDD